jgi:hypothetical protein
MMSTNKVYATIGTPITFKDSGGDIGITLANLGYGAGRLSARYDRGAGASRPVRHVVQGVFQFETAAVVGETVELWLFESDGTYADANVGTADAALTSVQRNNGKFIGAVVVPTTDGAANFIGSFSVNIYQRYFSIGVWNASGSKNLKNTANANLVIVTPDPDDIQAAA